MRVLCLFSGGKDSSYALHRMLTSGFDVVALLTIRSKNPDSWLYQVPGMEISHLFQQLIGIPVEIFEEQVNQLVRFARKLSTLDPTAEYSTG